MWKPKLLALPWRKHAEGGVIPGARTVPPGIRVFDGPSNDLWWVKVILNVGRPVVAVIVLVMCAPGEHYLARLSGWSHWLAWGMPATLTAYAGIAAVVATKRPKKSPGKKTAVAGAIISVLLAMGAQPIAHLYQRGLITGHQTLLTVVVSCIPALVFGHLLHMAAAPVDVPVDTRTTQEKIADAFEVPQDMVIHTEMRTRRDEVPRAEDMAEEISEPGPDAMMYRAGDEDGMAADVDALRQPVGTPIDVSGVPDDVSAWARDTVDSGMVPGLVYDSRDIEIYAAPPGTPEPDPMMPGGLPDTWRRQLSVVPDTPVNGVPAPVSLSRTVSPDTDTRTRDNGGQRAGSVRPAVRPSVPARRRTTGLAARVRDMAEDNKSDAEIKEELSGENPDSVRRTINRVRKERGEIT